MSKVGNIQALSESVLDNLANKINSIPLQTMYNMSDCQKQTDFL